MITSVFFEGTPKALVGCQAENVTARLTMLDPLGNAIATLLTIDGRLAAMVFGPDGESFRVIYLDDQAADRSIINDEYNTN